MLRQLGATSLFAAKFREAAARALLLPRRRIGGAHAALAAAQARRRSARRRARSSARSRCCSRPTASACATCSTCRRSIETLRDVQRAHACAWSPSTRRTPSPFAASLLFGYVANYLYDGDAPLAERRAQALSIDQAQLARAARRRRAARLLDRDAIDDVEHELQHLEPDAPRAHRRRHPRSAAPHRRSLAAERDARARSPGGTAERDRRRWCARGAPCACPSPARRGCVAVEDASRYRDALGTPLPPGLPEALLEPVARSAAAISCCATRARTGRSPPATSRAASGSARPSSRRRCAAPSAPAACTRATSVPAARIASGASPASSARSAGARWPAAARRSSRSNRPRSAGWSRPGRA